MIVFDPWGWEEREGRRRGKEGKGGERRGKEGEGGGRRIMMMNDGKRQKGG